VPNRCPPCRTTQRVSLALSRGTSPLTLSSVPMLAVTEMPRVVGFETPEELYCVQLEPSPLFGMGYPQGRTRRDWSALFDAGVRSVVCLASERVFYEPAPLGVLGSFPLEDLVHGGAPADAARELEMIRQATKLVVARLEAGEGVVVHCVGGRGRTGTVLGCALVALGHAPDDVVTYLDHVHAVRGSAGWPESPWQAGVVRAIAKVAWR